MFDVNHVIKKVICTIFNMNLLYTNHLYIYKMIVSVLALVLILVLVLPFLSTSGNKKMHC